MSQGKTMSDSGAPLNRTAFSPPPFLDTPLLSITE